MRYKIYYDKTLKMSPQKLAAQVGHVTLNLGYELGTYLCRALEPEKQIIVVLGLSHKKFNETLQDLEHAALLAPIVYHVQEDLGFTEVAAGTITAFGYIE